MDARVKELMDKGVSCRTAYRIAKEERPKAKEPPPPPYEYSTGRWV